MSDFIIPYSNPNCNKIIRRRIHVNQLLEPYFQITSVNKSDFSLPPVPKPDYTENIPESFLSSLLKKKED